jgi:cytochrome b561
MAVVERADPGGASSPMTPTSRDALWRRVAAARTAWRRRDQSAAIRVDPEAVKEGLVPLGQALFLVVKVLMVIVGILQVLAMLARLLRAFR